jgi:ELWxxDGT repeat protein
MKILKNMKNIVLIISVLLGVNCSVNAQIPSLLKDINNVGNNGLTSAYTILAGIVYFPHNDDIHGTELWRTDGTAAGTYMVKDINPGAESSMKLYEQPIVFNFKLYFRAINPNVGYEIFKSDGTAAGTQVAFDLASGTGSRNPYLLTNCGDHKLVFAALNSSNKYVVWQSDGTFSGTSILTDLNLDPGESTISGIYFFPTFLAGTVYIVNSYTGPNNGIWRTSFSCFLGCGAFSTPTIIPGTDNSSDLLLHYNTTNMQYDLYFRNTGSQDVKKYNLSTSTITNLTNFSSNLYIPRSNLSVINNTIIFAGKDASNGVEIWKTDGSIAGTGLLKDIYSGLPSSEIQETVMHENQLYFSAKTANGTNLWKTDGTSGGTIELLDLDPSNLIEGPKNIKVIGNKVYFYFDKLFSGYNYEWQFGVFDTSTSVFTVLKNFGVISDFEDYFNSIVFDSNLIFTAFDTQNGFEVWTTNGTVTGTNIIKNISQGSANAQNFKLATTSNKVFFTAIESNSYDQKLHKIELGLVVSKVSDLKVSGYIELNASTYIMSAANENYDFELWKTDGTSTGTMLVKDIYNGMQGSGPGQFVKLNNSIVFTAQVSNTLGEELWVTDGTTSGTVLLKDIFLGSTSSSPQYLVELNGFVYFSASSQTQGYELWRTDGTEAGTTQVKDIVPGVGSGSPKNLTKVGNKIFFVAQTPATGNELWVTDGTSAGTYLVSDIRPGALSSEPSELTAMGSNIYFSADNGTQGRELWQSNGNLNNAIVFNINQEHFFLGSVIIESSNPKNLTAFGNRLYFSAEQTIYTNPLVTYGRELWSYTIGGAIPTLVKNANPISGDLDGISPRFNGKFKNIGNIIYYPGTDGPHGFELWRSDGSEAGTFMVQDLYPGLPNGIDYINNFEMIGNPTNGIFYYNATNGQNGHELWAFEQCKNSQNIATTIAASSQRQQSSQFLTSSSNITNTNTSYGNLDINYRAGKAITLLPGFSVEGKVASK